MPERPIARLLHVLAFVALVLTIGTAHAADDRQAQIDAWNKTLDSISKTLENQDLEDSKLASLRGDAQTVADEASALVRELAPEISAVEKRIAELAPVEGNQPLESPSVTQARDEQKSKLADLAAISKQAEVARLKAEDLVKAIAERQSAVFVSRLFQRHDSLLAPALWKAVAVEAPSAATQFTYVVNQWLSSFRNSADRITLLVLSILALLTLIATPIVMRRLITRLAARYGDTVPSHREQVFAAAAIVAISVIVPLAVVVIVRTVLQALGLLPSGIDDALRGLMVSLAVFTLLHGLARALLAPSRPQWRFLPVDDWRATRAYSLTGAIATAMALVPLVAALDRMTGSATQINRAVGTLICLVAAVIIIMLARAATAPHVPEEGAAATPHYRGRQPQGLLRLLWHWGALVAMVAAAAAIVAGLSGYLALAQFVVKQIVWIGVIASSFALVAAFVDEMITTLTAGNGRTERWVSGGFGLRPRALVQSGIVVSGVLRLLLLFVAAFAVAAPYGVDSTSLTASIRGIFFGIKIGSINLTFSSIILALAIFLVGMFLTRTVQRWLDTRLLPTTDLNAGLRNSIRTIIGYVGIILAAALAGAYAGLDLSSVAIVAGALSVGIGFGLQSIVNNFVSGLILLAERPIRTGDWIDVGGNEGTVKRISVRATEIETFDRASVVIPNSDLISGVVKNMYLRDNSGRVTVTVGVSYDSDPEQVREILFACAREHPLVLDDPAPLVFFMDFGASSLDFDLRCYLADISRTLTVRSDLRFAIVKHFREAGIEIPFPQRDLNLRDWPKIEQAFGGRAGGRNDTDAEERS